MTMKLSIGGKLLATLVCKRSRAHSSKRGWKIFCALDAMLQSLCHDVRSKNVLEIVFKIERKSKEAMFFVKQNSRNQAKLIMASRSNGPSIGADGARRSHGKLHKVGSFLELILTPTVLEGA